MTQKSLQRATALALRMRLDEAAWEKFSLRICERLLELEILETAVCIHAYWPLLSKREVDIRPVIRYLHEQGKRVILPISTIGELRHGVFTNEVDLVEGRFGVFEPIASETVEIPAPDVVLVPAVAVDRSGNRIGYGKGYYDRFLQTIQTVKIAPVFSFQVLEGIRKEDFDVPVDILVTEHEVLRV